MTDDSESQQTGKWPALEHATIAATGEWQIATARPDDTVRKSVIVWGVTDGDHVYVRSVNGIDALWFRHAHDRMHGELTAGTAHRGVEFVDIPADDSALQTRLDAAYRTKYRGSTSAVERITSPAARAATLQLLPRA
ncbi:DUF2255 family protein [Aldersonia sp. NBC_00410]|uniref:DUF2255 family protein n=1 Tax=Aldersonia sp. NBC_00410 TaxID=2975954 RepID=UPI0022571275|nr:DUF2255 family protein [Aldersonia sp. NBC_00410]MCX5042679.1 DUF2255 family protein [Aldersonia sp. NBC_00410]